MTDTPDLDSIAADWTKTGDGFRRVEGVTLPDAWASLHPGYRVALHSTPSPTGGYGGGLARGFPADETYVRMASVGTAASRMRAAAQGHLRGIAPVFGDNPLQEVDARMLPFGGDEQYDDVVFTGPAIVLAAAFGLLEHGVPRVLLVAMRSTEPTPVDGWSMDTVRFWGHAARAAQVLAPHRNRAVRLRRAVQGNVSTAHTASTPTVDVHIPWGYLPHKSYGNSMPYGDLRNVAVLRECGKPPRHVEYMRSADGRMSRAAPLLREAYADVWNAEFDTWWEAVGKMAGEQGVPRWVTAAQTVWSLSGRYSVVEEVHVTSALRHDALVVPPVDAARAGADDVARALVALADAHAVFGQDAPAVTPSTVGMVARRNDVDDVLWQLAWYTAKQAHGLRKVAHDAVTHTGTPGGGASTRAGDSGHFVPITLDEFVDDAVDVPESGCGRLTAGVLAIFATIQHLWDQREDAVPTSALWLGTAPFNLRFLGDTADAGGCAWAIVEPGAAPGRFPGCGVGVAVSVSTPRLCDLLGLPHPNPTDAEDESGIITPEQRLHTSLRELLAWHLPAKSRQAVTTAVTSFRIDARRTVVSLPPAMAERAYPPEALARAVDQIVVQDARFAGVAVHAPDAPGDGGGDGGEE